MSLRRPLLLVALLSGAMALSAAAMQFAYVANPLAIPAGILGALAVVTACVRPRYTLYASLCAVPLDALAPIHVGPLSVSEGLLVLTAGGALVQALEQGRILMPSTPAGRAFGVFALVSLPSVLLGLDPGTGVKVLLITVVLLLIFEFVVAEADRDMALRLAACIAGAAALASVFALLNPGDSSVTYVGGESLRREAGAFAHSNTLATYLAMGIPLCVVLVGVAPRIARPTALMAVALLVVSLSLTLSRGGILATAASSAVLLLWQPVRRLAIVGVALLALLVGSGAHLVGGSTYVDTVTQRIASVSAASQGDDPRVAIWRGAFRMISDHPLLGVGPGAFATAAPAYGLYYPLGSDLLLVPPHAHDVLLNIAAERGLFAMLAFGVFLLATARSCFRAVRLGKGPDRLLAVGVSAALAAFVTQGLVDYTFSTNAIGAAVVVLGACAVVLDRVIPERRLRPLRARPDL